MTLLLENPLLIWAGGIVSLAVAVVVLLSKRTLSSAFAVVAVLAVTLGLVLLEKFVVTENELLEQSVHELLLAIETNNLPKVESFIAPDAVRILADARAMMPQVKVRETSVSSLRIEPVADSAPRRATTYFRGKLDGVHARSAARVFFFDQVEIDWLRSTAGWTIVDYRVHYRGKPINPSESLQSGRAIR